jgi:hypothetical protein
MRMLPMNRAAGIEQMHGARPGVSRSQRSGCDGIERDARIHQHRDPSGSGQVE